MRHIEPTSGQLQSAFASARKADWPADLDSALAHPIYGRLVRMNAMVLSEGGDPFRSRRITQRPVVVAPEPPHPAETPAPRIARPERQAKPRRASPPPTLSQLPPVDLKRAAAGDDDD